MLHCYNAYINITTVLLIFIVTACNFKSPANIGNNSLNANNPDSMAVAYYMMLANEQYDKYVGAMQSCNDMPSDYKKNVVSMLRHHNMDIKKEKQGVKKVAVLRSEMHNNDQLYNVFLEVTYNDGSQEEVMVTLVHDNEFWRIQ